MAELRAREAEAELRYLEATAKRKALKGEDWERNKERRSRRSNKKKTKGGEAPEA